MPDVSACTDVLRYVWGIYFENVSNLQKHFVWQNEVICQDGNESKSKTGSVTIVIRDFEHTTYETNLLNLFFTSNYSYRIEIWLKANN